VGVAAVVATSLASSCACEQRLDVCATARVRRNLTGGLSDLTPALER
jgi:hypothetical protein